MPSVKKALGHSRRHRSLHQVPDWVKKGARADYHAIINEPVTHEALLITEPPFMLGGHTPSVFLEGISGCVAIDALSRADGKKTKAQKKFPSPGPS
jgi:hypothetical protein